MAKRGPSQGICLVMGLFTHVGMDSNADNILKYAEIFLEAASSRADYMREYMANRYHSKRQEIIDRLGGKCARCGSMGPLHLDHIDKKKKKNRAADLHSVNDKDFEREVKNLQLLCTDCHKAKTNEAWDYGSNVPKAHHGYWSYRKGCRCDKCVKDYKKKQKEWRTKKKREP